MAFLLYFICPLRQSGRIARGNQLRYTQNYHPFMAKPSRKSDYPVRHLSFHWPWLPAASRFVRLRGFPYRQYSSHFIGDVLYDKNLFLQIAAVSFCSNRMQRRAAKKFYGGYGPLLSTDKHRRFTLTLWFIRFSKRNFTHGCCSFA